MEHLFIWVIVLVVVVGSRRIAEAFRNFRGGGRGGGPHALPASGPVESSRGAANPRESRPIGFDKRQ